MIEIKSSSSVQVNSLTQLNNNESNSIVDTTIFIKSKSVKELFEFLVTNENIDKYGTIRSDKNISLAPITLDKKIIKKLSRAIEMKRTVVYDAIPLKSKINENVSITYTLKELQEYINSKLVELGHEGIFRWQVVGRSVAYMLGAQFYTEELCRLFPQLEGTTLKTMLESAITAPSDFDIRASIGPEDRLELEQLKRIYTNFFAEKLSEQVNRKEAYEFLLKFHYIDKQTSEKVFKYKNLLKEFGQNHFYLFSFLVDAIFFETMIDTSKINNSKQGMLIASFGKEKESIDITVFKGDHRECILRLDNTQISFVVEKI